MRILARITNLLLARVRGILKKNLKLRKINARWIPHLLSEQLLRTKESPCKDCKGITKIVSIYT